MDLLDALTLAGLLAVAVFVRGWNLWGMAQELLY
jgi:hypothetical protein